jgi:hypothetical protein
MVGQGSATPFGVVVDFGDGFRRCRCAQPPATIWQPVGLRACPGGQPLWRKGSYIYEEFAKGLCRPYGAWESLRPIPQLALWAKFCRPVRGWGWKGLPPSPRLWRTGAARSTSCTRRCRKVSEGVGRSVKVSEGSFFMVKENKVLLRGRQEFIYGQEPGELGGIGSNE